MQIVKIPKDTSISFSDLAEGIVYQHEDDSNPYKYIKKFNGQPVLSNDLENWILTILDTGLNMETINNTIISKEKYVLGYIKNYIKFHRRTNKIIDPRIFDDLIEQFEFDYDMELKYRPEILKEESHD